MKTVYFLRHGHAEPEKIEDKDRKLSKQGIVQVQKVGTLFTRAGNEAPQTVVSSSAIRTRETSKLFLGTIKKPDLTVDFRDNLYLANETRIISLIEASSDAIATILYVGHNPGIEQAAASLSEQYLPMGTAALVILKFDIPHWSLMSSTTPSSVEVLEP